MVPPNRFERVPLVNPHRLSGSETLELILRAGAEMAAKRQAESSDDPDPDLPEDGQ